MTDIENLNPNVDEILVLVGLDKHLPRLRSIAIRLATGADVAIQDAHQDLIDIDKTIPGFGLHNVNEHNGHGGLTGVYSLRDRAIFRGIQYVGMYLSFNNLEWLARKIVTDSCYHVESSLKRRLNETDSLSVGRILHRHRKALSRNLSETLSKLNSTVYNEAKHTVEDIDFDSHMFSIVDALAIYLVCRKIGVCLLKDMDIKTKYGKPVFE